MCKVRYPKSVKHIFTYRWSSEHVWEHPVNGRWADGEIISVPAQTAKPVKENPQLCMNFGHQKLHKILPYFYTCNTMSYFYNFFSIFTILVLITAARDYTHFDYFSTSGWRFVPWRRVRTVPRPRCPGRGRSLPSPRTTSGGWQTARQPWQDSYRDRMKYGNDVRETYSDTSI